MKERPILMSAPMVRAILEGRKSQTRRVVKPQPEPVQGAENRVVWFHRRGFHVWTPGVHDGPVNYSPYGEPGDRLWVRESVWINDGDVGAGRLRYRADEPDFRGKWRPSIHMPRWASRITLEVTGVRVERLHEISEEDALAEGAPLTHAEEAYEVYTSAPRPSDCGMLTMRCHRYGFQKIWGEINGPGSWALNPWVWVVEFKEVEP